MATSKPAAQIKKTTSASRLKSQQPKLQQHGEVHLITSSKQTNSFGDKRGLHPNSLKNLEKGVSWKPGESGHPQGESLLACLQRLSLKPLVPPGPGASAREHLAYVTLRDALAGQPVQFRESWDRLEGRVKESLEVHGPAGHLQYQCHPDNLGKLPLLRHTLFLDTLDVERHYGNSRYP